ncbi:MAG: hypothetical protein OEZ59_05485 [Deltaproteobacteria bacterium]|nr:hypothetical protein [Deltaproteobacteria bacterium]
MLNHLSQREADLLEIPAVNIQSVSPYVNPGHVLAPPRHWLESLAEGEYSWAFFSLRYKTMLRDRFRDTPERFMPLLETAAGEEPLYLTCHCMAGHCHAELAVEFLGQLRGTLENNRLRTRQRKVRRGRTGPGGRSRNVPPRQLILSSLIEHPQPRVSNG